MCDREPGDFVLCRFAFKIAERGISGRGCGPGEAAPCNPRNFEGGDALPPDVAVLSAERHPT